MTRTTWVIAALAACAIAPLAAHRAQTPSASAPQQTFRSTTDVVEVDASVFDKNGKPVTDLTAADFQLKENGTPQRVTTVYLVTGDPVLLKTTPVAPDGVIMPKRMELKQRVLVFMLDLAHLSNAGFVRSRKAIRSFVADPATPADVIGVVVNGQMLNNRLETDRAVLLKAIDALPAPKSSRFDLLREWPKFIDEGEATRVAHGGTDLELAASGTSLLSQVIQRACLERPSECQSDQNPRASAEIAMQILQQTIETKARQIASDAARDAQISLQSITALANGLSRFPGTKQVAFFSEGFYADELIGPLRNVVGLAAQSGVRVSTLDARGITSGANASDFMNASPTPIAAGSMQDTDADVLSSLAIDTGGRFVQRFNDLRPSLDTIATDGLSYYVVAYAPAVPADGSYRSIDVSVSRANLTVRARRGYIAAPHPAPAETTASSPGTRAGAASPVTPPPTASPSAAPAGSPLPAPAAASAEPAPIHIRPGGSEHVTELEAIPAVSSGDAARAETLAKEGWALYGTGDVEHARDRLAAAVATRAEPLWAEYALGLSQYALRQFQPAADAWEHVRQVRPDYEPAYLDLADAYLSLGRLTDVLSVLREAAHRWPADPAPHNAIGVVLIRRDDMDGAIKEFETATLAAPAESLGFYNLGRAYQLRYDRLLRTTSNPDSAAARALGERDRDHAIEAYTKYLKIGGPFERQAREALGVLGWKTS